MHGEYCCDFTAHRCTVASNRIYLFLIKRPITN
uniref:Uncharacterized protein n=1 Tax=Arundo donax TaxID=35708 RepID=A0A0A8ZWH5_ARUDO